MWAIVHVLVGVFLGKQIDSLYLVILISLILHYVFDMFPHWDFADLDKKHFSKTGEIIISKITVVYYSLDIIFSLILMYFLFKIFDNNLIIFGGIFSLVPDFLNILYKTPLKKNKFYMNSLKFHAKIQKETTFLKSLLSQGIIIILLLILIFNY
jgi:hypothetical protein